MTTVFVSYSREDRAFVERLCLALVAAGQDVWLDTERIPAWADWVAEIKNGIEGANAFAFVISPDSLASRICRYELDHALAHRKRIVPVLRRDAKLAGMPEPLARRRWTFLRAGEDFDAVLPGLVAAIEGTSPCPTMLRRRPWPTCSDPRNDAASPS